MTELGNVTFTGASGHKYNFKSYPLDQKFNPVPAVVVVTHRAEAGRGGNTQHRIVYIGQLEDIAGFKVGMRRQICFEDHGANCICVLAERDQNRRLTIGTDLLKKFQPPCNQK
ncbi:MAG: hypothetical protein WD270_01190 [Acetobacterales bacterium]